MLTWMDVALMVVAFAVSFLLYYVADKLRSRRKSPILEALRTAEKELEEELKEGQEVEGGVVEETTTSAEAELIRLLRLMRLARELVVKDVDPDLREFFVRTVCGYMIRPEVAAVLSKVSSIRVPDISVLSQRELELLSYGIRALGRVEKDSGTLTVIFDPAGAFSRIADLPMRFSPGVMEVRGMTFLVLEFGNEFVVAETIDVNVAREYLMRRIEKLSGGEQHAESSGDQQ